MTTSPRPPRLTAKPTIAHFRVFRSTFAVATHSALALDFLRRHYGPSVNEDAELDAVTFALWRVKEETGRRWGVYVGDQHLADSSSWQAVIV